MLGPFAFLAADTIACTFELGTNVLAARAFVFGLSVFPTVATTSACVFMLGSNLILVACAFGFYALDSTVLAAVARAFVHDARTLLLGSLVLRAIAAAARAFVLDTFVLDTFVLLAVVSDARALSTLVLLAACTFVLGPFEFLAAVRTFVLGTLVLPAAASVARDVGLGTLLRRAVTTGVRVLVLGSFVLSAAAISVHVLVLDTLVHSAGAQACCFTWIGSSRGGLRPGSHVLRPRALC